MPVLDQNASNKPYSLFTIEASSRLHLGLLEICDQQPNQYGGIGLMVRDPRATLSAEIGDRALPDLVIHGNEYWSERIRKTCDHWLAVHHIDRLPIQRFTCHRTVSPHVGLGSGTQIACAVISLLERASGRSMPDLARLAHLSLRGSRSFVGLTGFLQGGLIVDYGLASETNDRVSRFPFPEEWPIMLIRTTQDVGDFGESEKRMFAECSQFPNPNRQRMLMTIEDRLLPALKQKDWQSWDTHVGTYGQMAGNVFATVQGGVYRFPIIAEIVESLRKIGCLGTAQSSWGPTAMLACRDQDQADWVLSYLTTQFSEISVEQTFACNQPASWLQA